MSLLVLSRTVLSTSRISTQLNHGRISSYHSVILLMVLVITTTSLLEIAASSTSSVPSTTSTPPTPPTPSTSSSRCDNSNRAKITPFVSIRLPGRNYEHDCDDNDNDDDDDDDFRHHSPRRGWITVTGREFNLFDTRGGVQETSNKASDNPSILVSKQSRNREDDDTISSTDNHRPHPYYDDIHNSDNDEESTIQAPWAMNAAATNDGTAAARTRPVGLQRQAQTPPLPKQYFRSSAGGVNAAGGATTSGNSGSSGFFKSNNNNNVPKPPIFQSVQEWWTSNISPTIKDWPRIQCRVEPTTTLKIRKTFRPLKTIVRLGADFNTQLGVWQFKSSWEDAIIGGKITLSGRELQLSKSWQLSVGTYLIADSYCFS